VTRILLAIALLAAAWTAHAADEPCSTVPRDPEFSACWNAEFKKSEADMAAKLRTLADRHRKDEPGLHRLIGEAQRRWVAWREAACKVDTFESKGTAGFSVSWDRCHIRMNKARAAELQQMIDSP
jgi:uncharacterized protein YecT (DUF1311 family)